MELDSLTTLLILSLVTKSDQPHKDKRKTLIKLAKRSKGAVNSVLTRVLNSRDMRKEVSALCKDHLDMAEFMAITRAGGGHGVIITENEFFPIFVSVKNHDDKELALQSELGIVKTATQQLKNFEYKPGALISVLLFKSAGFSGLPHRVILQ